MPVVVTDNCQKCKFTECVAVCPVSCFHHDDEMVYVDPVLCIDCRACLPACPVMAIYDLDDLPGDKRHWIAINAERSVLCPSIIEKCEPLPYASQKRQELGYS